ncbi:hypothetical protein LZ198_37480 [Myxococcus sp. K15C18031901]|uniref:hypothetical protein n=1 Tax=Myxococcus dinghuensis TaxID=2906761 RepID=UPI0020A70629|nr:hypothetical protein [Myxococcus dinghuensis]MCP3104570.1 hypothetical protein [Myxococcus dinghuensis]
MKFMSRVIALGALCLAAACGGAPTEQETNTATESSEQELVSCSVNADCASGQTCASGTCYAKCPSKGSCYGFNTCCPAYTMPNGNPTEAYCARACYAFH